MSYPSQNLPLPPDIFLEDLISHISKTRTSEIAENWKQFLTSSTFRERFSEEVCKNLLENLKDSYIYQIRVIRGIQS